MSGKVSEELTDSTSERCGGMAMQSLGKSTGIRKNRKYNCPGTGKSMEGLSERKKAREGLMQSFIHPASKYILSFCYVAGTVLGPGNVASDQSR